MMHIIRGMSLMHLLKNHEKICITTREGTHLAHQTHSMSCSMPHIYIMMQIIGIKGTTLYQINMNLVVLNLHE